MAKYEVLMSCGHEDTVEIIGKNTDRERNGGKKLIRRAGNRL